MSVFVFVNGQSQQISTNSLPPATGYPKASFSFFADLNEGQTIDFIVYANSSISFDRTDFDASIVTLAPEVTNGSFQDPDYTAGGTEGGSTMPGWTKAEAAYSSPGIQVDGKPNSPPAPDGDQWCYFNLVANLSGGHEGSLWQSVGYALDEHIYTTEFVLGNRQGDTQGSIAVSLWQGGSAPSVAGGSTLIGEAAIIPPSVSSTITQTNRESFTTGTGLNYAKLWLRFDFSIPAGSSGYLNQLLLDAVRLEVEPVMSNSGTIILIQ